MTALAILAIAIPVLACAAVLYRAFRSDLAGLAFVLGITILILALAAAFAWGLTYMSGALA